MDVFDKATSWRDLKIAKATGYYPYFKAISDSEATEVTIEGRRVIMIGSNNYLGLTRHPKVVAAAHEALDKYGTSCSGSRLLNGTLELHNELERRFARFLKKDAAICITTGFTTNLAVLSSLLGRGDVVFSDRQNHASLVDGVRLSYAEEKRFRHNDMAQLEKLLRETDPKHGKLIVTDGVFSMEGDLTDAVAITRLAKQYGARVAIDDAHGLGVMGAHGRGTAEHFGVEDDVDLVLGTFSKSFASLGGVVAGPQPVIDWIRHKARPFIFQAAMTPASAASAMAALEVIESEPERRERLWVITEKMQRGFKGMGFDTGVSVTPVVPLLVGEQLRCFKFWKALFEAGVFCNPVIPPAVSANQCLLRTSYMATHTDAQLDRVLDITEQIGKKLGVIPQIRPHTSVTVKVASPGHNNFLVSAEKASGPQASLWSNGQVRDERPLRQRISDVVERVTWQAINTKQEDLVKVTELPGKLWQRRAELPSLLVEKSVGLVMRNGKSNEA
jgi:8-amino-7-oxononanoate synthase